MKLLEKQVGSYGPFQVVSSLIFGFAVNFSGRLYGNAFGDNVGLEFVFSCLIALVLICSAFAMIVMSLTNYHVRRCLAGGSPQRIKMAQDYLILYATYRKAARAAFYSGLILFMLSVLIYVQPHLQLSTQIAFTIILGFGIAVIGMTTFTLLRPKEKIKIERLLLEQDTVRSEQLKNVEWSQDDEEEPVPRFSDDGPVTI